MLYLGRSTRGFERDVTSSAVQVFNDIFRRFEDRVTPKDGCVRYSPVPQTTDAAPKAKRKPPRGILAKLTQLLFLPNNSLFAGSATCYFCSPFGRLIKALGSILALCTGVRIVHVDFSFVGLVVLLHACTAFVTAWFASLQWHLFVLDCPRLKREVSFTDRAFWHAKLDIRSSHLLAHTNALALLTLSPLHTLSWQLAEAIPVAGSGLKLPLDLHAIGARCSNAYFAPRRFAAVQLAFSNPRCRVLVFHTGRLVGTGARASLPP